MKVSRNSSRFTYFLKTTSAVVAVFFTVNTVFAAAPISINGGAMTSSAVNLGADSFSWFEGLQVPESFGRIESRYWPKETAVKGPAVIHIQDAHANPEAQRHIAELLGDLEARGIVSRISVEGAAGPLHPEILKVSSRSDINLKMADYLLELGELSGAELFALKHPQAPEILGAENTDLYRQSYQTFEKVKRAEVLIRPVLDTYAKELERLQIALFPKELHEYVIRSNEWHRSQERSFRYFDLLARYGREYLGLDFHDARLQFEWPMFVRLMALQDMESKIDSEKSRSESQEIVKALNASGNKISTQDREAFDFLSKKIKVLFDNPSETAAFVPDSRYSEIESIRSLMEFLKRKSQAARLELSLYPDFVKRSGVLILREEIDARMLFSEMEKVERQLEEKMSVSDAEKSLLKTARDFRLLEKLLSLTLTREEYETFSSRVQDFQPAAFRERFRLLDRELKQEKDYPLLSSETVTAAAEFYKLSRSRDEILLDQALSGASGQAVVLVTGGFHSQGMTDLLKERKIPHVVIAPKITTAGEDGLYDKVMMGGHSSSEAPANPALGTLAKMILSQLPSVYGVLQPGTRPEEQAALIFRGLRDAALPALREQGVPEQVIYDELSRWVSQTGVFSGTDFQVSFDSAASRVSLSGAASVETALRSELRMAPEPDTLAWIAANLPEDANRQKVVEAITALNDRKEKDYAEANGAYTGMSLSDFLLQNTAESIPDLDGLIRDVSRIEGLVQEVYSSFGIGGLSLAHRAAFILGAFSQAEFPVIHEALQTAYGAIRFDEHRYSEDLSAEEYARLARKFSEAVSRETVQENLLIRAALTEYVFNIPAQARRALEKENLVNELIRELQEPGKGRVPNLTFLTDLHGSTKVGSFIAFALGIDDYAGITSPQELERRLVADWQKKNPGAPEKSLNEILEERNVLIVGGSDYVDRGPKPYWGFQFNKWLREHGLLKFINGNHDLWKDWNVVGMHLRVHDTLRDIAASGKFNEADLAANIERIQRFVTTAGWDPEKDRTKFEDTEAQVREIMKTFMLGMQQGAVTDALIETVADAIIDSGNNANHSLEWWAREWGIHGGWFDTFLDQINEELINEAINAANIVISQEANAPRVMAMFKDESLLPEEIRPYVAAWREKLKAGKPMFDRVEASLFSKGEDVKTLKAEIERIKKANAEIRSANEKLAAEKRFGEMSPQHKVPSAFELTAKAAQAEMSRIKKALETLNDLLPGLNLPVPESEVVTQQNYRTNPSVAETALWDWKNFRLLYTDVYDNVYVHGIIPVDVEKLDFNVTYTNPQGEVFRGIAAIERIQYEVRSFFEKYDALPDTPEFRAELDAKLGAAFQVLNEWYSDVLGFLKPESIQGFLKSGGAKSYPFGQGSDLSPRQFKGALGAMHVGHVESAKLRKQKMSYWIGGMEGGLLHGDFEMSEGYSGLGAIIQWFRRDAAGKLLGFSRFGYKESVSFYNNQIKEKEKKLKEAAAVTAKARTDQKAELEIQGLEAAELKLRQDIEALKVQREALVSRGEQMEDITFHDDLLPADAEKIRPYKAGGDLARYYIDRFLRENIESYRSLKEEASKVGNKERAAFYERREQDVRERLKSFRKQESERMLDVLSGWNSGALQALAAARAAVGRQDYAAAAAALMPLTQSQDAGEDFTAALKQTAQALELFSRAELRGEDFVPQSELVLSDMAGSPAQVLGLFAAAQIASPKQARSELRSFDDDEEVVLSAELQNLFRDGLGMDPATFSREENKNILKSSEVFEFLINNPLFTGARKDQLRSIFQGNLTSWENLAAALLAARLAQPGLPDPGVEYRADAVFTLKMMERLGWELSSAAALRKPIEERARNLVKVYGAFTVSDSDFLATAAKALYRVVGNSFHATELIFDTTALTEQERHTVEQVQPFLEYIQNNNGFFGDRLGDLWQIFHNHLTSPSDMAKAFIESVEVSFKAPATSETPLIPDDAVHGHALKLIKSLLTLIPQDQSEIRLQALEKARAILSSDHTYHVVLSAIEVFDAIGTPALQDLVLYSAPSIPADYRKNAIWALARHRDAAVPYLAKLIMEEPEARSRNALAELLQRVSRESEYAPEPVMRRDVFDFFIGDRKIAEQLFALMGGQLPFYRQFINSSWLIPFDTKDRLNVLRARVALLQKFKGHFTASDFSTLLETWGFDSVSYWAERVDFTAQREHFQFLINLPRLDKSISPVSEAIQISRRDHTPEHTRSILLLLLEGGVLSGGGIGALIDLIRENPRDSVEIMAFLIVALKLQDFDFGEDGVVQRRISQLLHSNIGPVYFMARKLAKSIPHATNTSAGLEAGIRAPIAELDDSLGHGNMLFYFLRMEFHRAPSTGDLEVMRQTLRLMLDLHHPVPEKRIKSSDVDRVIRVRMQDLVRNVLHTRVFPAFKAPLVEQAAWFIGREVMNMGGTENDSPDYLLEHPPTWANFTDEEKQSEGYRAAQLLIRTFIGLRDRYVLNPRAIEFMNTGGAAKLASEGDVLGALRALQDWRQGMKQSLLTPSEMEDQWEMYIKRHITVNDFGYVSNSSYGNYSEAKFNEFERDRVLERFAENLHDEFLARLFPQYQESISQAAQAQTPAETKPETVLPESIREPLKNILLALRALVNQMAMDGIANERLVTLMRVLETESLDVRQAANIIALMQDESIRMYDFFNFHFSDYPKQLALTLGKERVFARYRKDNDDELTDKQWASRAQETLLADMNAEEKTISTLKRYLESLQVVFGSLKAQERQLLNPIPLIVGDLPVYSSSFDPETVSPVKVGSKAYELLTLKASGYPVPALSVLPSELPRTTKLAVANPMFRFSVLRSLLELEKESGRVFPFPSEGLTDAEKEQVRVFRQGYAFNPDAPPLSISIRSGSFYSMPGMMDTVLNMPFNEAIRDELIRRGEPEVFVLDNYRRFLSAYAISRYGIDSRFFSEAIDELKQKAAQRLGRSASAITIAQFNVEELKEVIQKFEEIISSRVSGFELEDPFTQVLKVTMDVYKSWNSNGATRYRQTFGISERFGTAVIYEQMVYGNRGSNSGTAVVISSDPAMGKHYMSGAWKFGGQGTELVSGMTGDYIALTHHEGQGQSLEAINPALFSEVRQVVEKLDRDRGPQDIEITAEDGKVYLLQTRPMVLSGKAPKMVLEPEQSARDAAIPAVQGVPVSPNAAVGRMVNARNLSIPKLKGIITELRRKMDEAGEEDLGIILVSDYVNDDTAAAILDVNSELGHRGITGIINSKVGVSSHAGLIARRLGIAYVSDVEGLEFNDVSGVTRLADQDLKFGMAGLVLSIDGYSTLQSEHSGKVFLGEVTHRFAKGSPTLGDRDEEIITQEEKPAFSYDPEEKPVLTKEPVRLAVNLGAFRVDKQGQSTGVLESNFDLSRAKITNTVPNRVFDAFLRSLVGNPNFSLTDIYGVEDAEKFFAFLRGNIAHGVFDINQMDVHKETDFWVLTLNGHNIRIHEAPAAPGILNQKVEYLIDFSDPDLTRETNEQREQRLKALQGGNLKRVFAFSGDEDPAARVLTPGINTQEFTDAQNLFLPLASPLTLAAAQVLSVIEKAFPGEFDVFSSVLATRPLSGEAGNIAFIRDKQFGSALKGLFPQIAPEVPGSPATMFEFDIPKGAGNVRLFLVPKPGSKFEQVKSLGKDEKAAMIKVLQKEINKAVETAAKGSLAPFLRYAGEEHLSSLTALRDTHAVVFDSQATAVVEGGKVELYFHMNDIGYAAALSKTLESFLAVDAEPIEALAKPLFAKQAAQGIWRTGTIAPNQIIQTPRFVAAGDEIGFGIIGVRGRIGKQVHQLLASNPNYVPEFWIGVQDIDTLIQQFKEDVGQGPADVVRDDEVYELEKGKDENKDHVLLKNKKTGAYLLNPKTNKPLAIPYYNITMKAQGDPEAFERHLRETLGDAIDRIETLFNAAGFGLDRNDPYYDAFLGGAKLKRIVLTAPAKGEVDVTVVRGVNESALAKAVENTEGQVLFCSAASCTTNGLGRALIEFVGILENAGFPADSVRFITHHAMTPSQGALFGAASAGKSQRTANDPNMSAMLEATGANKVVVEVWNSFKGKLSGVSHRDGNYAGSVLVVTAFIKAGENKYPTAEEINRAFEDIAAREDLKGILSYKPGVISTGQIAGDRTTSMFLPEFTKVEIGKNGAAVTMVVGYDNEAGYTNAVIQFDQLLAMAARGVTPPAGLGAVDAANKALENKIYMQRYEALLHRVRGYLNLKALNLEQNQRAAFLESLQQLLAVLQQNTTSAGGNRVLEAARDAFSQVERIGTAENTEIRQVENDLENTIFEIEDALNGTQPRSELRSIELAIEALGNLGLSISDQDRIRFTSVEDAARYADQQIRVNFASLDLAGLKSRADKLIREGHTPYQGREAIERAVRELNEIRGIDAPAFLNHLANLVSDRIREIGSARSELRDLSPAAPAFEDWKASYQTALPFLGADYESRRWVAVHMADGLFAVVPAALEPIIRDAAMQFLKQDLFYFDGNFERPTDALGVPASTQPSANQPGLEISVTRKIEDAETHFLAVATLLARKDQAYVHELLLDGDPEEAARLNQAFREEYGYTGFAGRYQVTAVSSKDLGKKIQGLVSGVYNNVRSASDAANLQDFIARHVAFSSPDRELLVKGLVNTGWLIHDDLGNHPGIIAARMDRSVSLAAGQLEPELIRKLGEIAALRKVISASGELFAGMNLQLIQDLWDNAVKQRWFYKSA